MFLAVLTVVLVVVVLVVAAIAAFAVRRRLIQRPGGTFDCSFRSGPAGSPTASSGNLPGGAAVDSGTGPGPDGAEGEAADHGKGWVFGIARYSGDRIEWFRVFSYSPRPRRVLERNEIDVVGRRPPVGQEELALLSGAVVLDCRHAGESVELAMSEDALTGFLAWLEAAPPGQRVNVA